MNGKPTNRLPSEIPFAVVLSFDFYAFSLHLRAKAIGEATRAAQAADDPTTEALAKIWAVRGCLAA